MSNTHHHDLRHPNASEGAGGHIAGGQEELSQSVLEVAQAEAQAKAVVEKTELQKVEMLSNARKKAAEIIVRAENQAEEEREALIAEERSKIAAETNALVEQARKKAGEFKQKPFKQLAARLAAGLLPK